MRADLLKGLSEDDQKNLERLWKESGALRELLATMLERKLVQVISAEDADQQYENPNWMLTVADSRGYRRGLKYAIDLLNQRGSAE